MSRFNTSEPKICSKVRIKENLTVGEMIGSYYITTHMLIYAGKVFIIVDINNNSESNCFYQINEGSFWWHKSWFDIIEE